MAQQQQRQLWPPCEKPLAEGGGFSLTVGCCKKIFHDKCIASYCCEQSRVSTPKEICLAPCAHLFSFSFRPCLFQNRR